MINLVVADDHPIFLAGLEKVLGSNKNFNLLEQASSGDEALEKILSSKPDIAILDLDMPGMNGFEIVKELNKKNFSTKVIFLTMHSAHDLLDEALRLKVMGYVLKETALLDIINAVETVYKGEHFISAALSEDIISHSSFSSAANEVKLLIEKLSPAEKKIFRQITNQKSTKESAGLMFISYRTVEKHRSNICDKLNISGNNALLKFALENKDYF